MTNKLADATSLPKMLFTSESDEWETPDELVGWLNQTFQFSLDPCCRPESAKAPRFFTIEDDGLAQSWAGERVWMNPPYSNVTAWMEKAYRESQENRATVVCLVAARTDTRWWQDWVLGKANEIQYLAGRVSFKRPGKEPNTAPFPSALVIYRPPIERKHTRPPIKKSKPVPREVGQEDGND